jgi:hypothetical protein
MANGGIALQVGSFQIFAFNTVKLLDSSTSASIGPHKKAVKKIEAEGFISRSQHRGAKEKQNY